MTATASAQTGLQRVVEIVEREARSRFGEVQIANVEVSEDEDTEGWPFLAINVIVHDSRKLNSAKLVGFIRKLREALEHEAGEDRFPVVTYDEARPSCENPAEAC